MGIGKGTVYCRVCGNRIPSVDFDGGHAGTDSGGHFCRDCSADVDAVSGGDGDDRASKPSRKNRTQNVPFADARPAPRFPLVAAALIGFIVLALLLYVALRSSGRPG